MSAKKFAEKSAETSADPLILASRSPRRRELLKMLLASFTVRPAGLDETPVPEEAALEYVARIAREKAQAVAGAAVLAADTAVVVDGEILGKPDGPQDARAMLERLSGRWHSVHTAVALRAGGRCRACTVTTAVEFAALAPGQVDAYLDGDEPWDKAGGYGIQGQGGTFVRRIHGSYSNVVGLPLVETRELLAAAGLLPDAGEAGP